MKVGENISRNCSKKRPVPLIFCFSKKTKEALIKKKISRKGLSSLTFFLFNNKKIPHLTTRDSKSKIDF